MIPRYVLVDSGFFLPRLQPGEELCGRICATFLDREQQIWIAFEMADMHGVFVISTQSHSFRGFSND